MIAHFEPCATLSALSCSAHNNRLSYVSQRRRQSTLSTPSTPSTIKSSHAHDSHTTATKPPPRSHCNNNARTHAHTHTHTHTHTYARTFASSSSVHRSRRIFGLTLCLHRCAHCCPFLVPITLAISLHRFPYVLCNANSVSSSSLLHAVVSLVKSRGILRAIPRARPRALSTAVNLRSVCPYARLDSTRLDTIAFPINQSLSYNKFKRRDATRRDAMGGWIDRSMSSSSSSSSSRRRLESTRIDGVRTSHAMVCRRRRRGRRRGERT